ncbi:MAG: MIP family channel protein [Anaerolineae bacterium]|nr:MIP family channel protein [Anaerolineae bacterium]
MKALKAWASEQVGKVVAELLGTFVLVFAGTGAIVVNDMSGGTVTHVGVAVVFGLVVMAMIYAVGDVSGAHFNPAVSVAFWLAKRMPGHEVLPYMLSQIGGAIAGSVLVWAVYPQHPNLGATVPSVPVVKAFLLEVVLTFILMFVIIHVSTGAKEKGLMAGAAIGATVCLEAIFAGPMTGASMNPARSLAPTLVSGQMSHVWIYLVAPFIGAALASVSCRLLRGPECCAVQDGETYSC